MHTLQGGLRFGGLGAHKNFIHPCVTAEISYLIWHGRHLNRFQVGHAADTTSAAVGHINLPAVTTRFPQALVVTRLRSRRR
jgi:hypothetical protein